MIFMFFMGMRIDHQILNKITLLQNAEINYLAYIVFSEKNFLFLNIIASLRAPVDFQC